MQNMQCKGWLVFWSLFCFAVALIAFSYAAEVQLDAFVTFAILQNDGTTPLVDGSQVFVFGSSNSVIDPMRSYGPGPVNTNFEARSVTGDDVFLASVRIGDNVASNGTFFATLNLEFDEIKYAYIRFFQTTDDPILGLQLWNTSAIAAVVPFFGVASIDFNPIADVLIANNQDNFVVIPEPGTANLLVLFFCMMFGMRSRMKKDLRSRRRKSMGLDP